VTAAVQATAKQVVLSGGKVATTYFSSSSGGRTVSAQEAYGHAVPYLVSVDDPYDTLSPYHDWGPVLFDARKVGKLLHADGDLLDLQLTPGPSQHVETVTVVGSKGTTSVTGNTVRSALGLRSSWFSVGWLTLVKPIDQPAGGAVTLTGSARGVPGPIALEAKTGTAAWAPVAAVTPGGNGAFSVVVHPAGKTSYRLAAGNIRAAVVTVP
jgi:SpoIID/LytB domain protein